MMGRMDDVGTIGSRSEGSPSSPRPPVDVLIDALADPGATVTEVLQRLVGEPVVAHKLDQIQTTARAHNRLDVAPGHPLARRVTVLRGERSCRPYLYAETLIVTGRLPPETWRRLVDGNDPIGRVIVEDRLAMTRVGITSERPSFEERPLGVTGDPIYARRYRLDIGTDPVMEIAEWFLPDLTDFLSRDRRG
jgi:chorismate-pyruvate lyase